MSVEVSDDRYTNVSVKRKQPKVREEGCHMLNSSSTKENENKQQRMFWLIDVPPAFTILHET